MSVVTKQLTGPEKVPLRRLIKSVSRTVPSNATYRFPANELKVPGRDTSGFDRSDSAVDCFCCTETDVGGAVSRCPVWPSAASCASASRSCASQLLGRCCAESSRLGGLLLLGPAPASCSASWPLRYVKATLGANSDRYCRFFRSSFTGSGGGGCW